MNDEVSRFILSEMPVGILVYNQEMEVICANRKASEFLEKYELPAEITDIGERIFGAIKSSTLKKIFPGEIHISRRFGGSLSGWKFKMSACESQPPYVAVFITEQPIWNRINLSRIRQQNRLTRRETDVIRRTLEGMKNAEIANVLEISEQTVKDHLSNVYFKLNVDSKFSMLRFFIDSSMPE